MARIVLLLLSMLWAAVPAAADLAGPATVTDVAGPATVIDGETLEVGGKRFRLWGIDAPDPRQTCRIRDRDYACGRVAATALMDLVAGVMVRCRPAADHSGRARCFADGYELSEGMVHTGWALAMPRTGTRLAAVERRAAAARRGLWQGDFAFPWAWRPAAD